MYFVNDQIIFRCRQADYSEQCIDHKNVREAIREDVSLFLSVLHMADPIHDYSAILTHYTHLALTNEGDALHAMAGIIRRFSERLSYQFLQGLPVGALEAFLMFQSAGGRLRRRAGLPSYSWAGWRGGITLNLKAIDLDSWLEFQTWIVWYKKEARYTPPYYPGSYVKHTTSLVWYASSLDRYSLVIHAAQAQANTVGQGSIREGTTFRACHC